MRILGIRAKNFKMHNDFSLDFKDGANYVVSGKNRVGKTTLANMVLWNLTGKDIEGRSDFEIRTRNIEPDNDVVVTGIYRFEDKVMGENGLTEETKDISLTRKYVARFEGKGLDRRYAGDLIKYEIDGIEATAKQYKEAVNRLFNQYNVSDNDAIDLSLLLDIKKFMYKMNNKEQRQILSKLFSKKTDKDILEENKEKYADIATYIYNKNDLAVVRKQFAGQVAELSKEVGSNVSKGAISIRIAERKNDKSGLTIDIDAKTAEKMDVESKMDELRAKIARVQNGSEVEKVRNEINNLQNQLKELDLENKKYKEDLYAKSNLDIIEKNKELGTDKIRKEQELSDLRYDIAECNKVINSKEAEIQRLNEERTKWQSQVWNGDENCPACGQRLPEDRIKQSKAKFNSIKVSKLETIEKNIVDAQNVVDENKQKLATLPTIENIEKELSDITTQIKDLQSTFVTTDVDMPNYVVKKQKIEEKIASKQQEQSRLNGEQEKEIAELNRQRDEYKVQLENCQRYIDIYNKDIATDRRIEELQEQLKEKSKELSKAERLCALIDDFNYAKALEQQEEINDKFEYVEWQLFSKNKGDDSIKDKCVCIIKDDNGNTFEGTNKASRINATIDIMNAFNKALNCKSILFIDDSEGITNDNYKVKTDLQTIKLKVVEHQNIIMYETEEEYNNRIMKETEYLRAARQAQVLDYIEKGGKK